MPPIPSPLSFPLVLLFVSLALMLPFLKWKTKTKKPVGFTGRIYEYVSHHCVELDSDFLHPDSLTDGL